ncbi:hypothetical protein TNCV_5060031 [Trichonephila clavipes]|nr:hypothetical protein TNCV_5060031 [Trichonephila clavipes]
MPCARIRNGYHHVSDFDKGRIVAYRNCRLSYCSNVARVARDPMTVSRLRKQACYPHGLNGSHSHGMSPESRISVVRKTTSACNNCSTTFAAAWTLSSDTIAAATLDSASQTGASSMHQDGRISVRCPCGERTLAEFIRHRHTGLSPGVIVWVLLDTSLGHLFALTAI